MGRTSARCPIPRFSDVGAKSVTAKIIGVLLLFGASLLAQSTTVIISDSNGNQTTGTITNGNVFFHDSQGNIAFGTIKNGNVFLNTSNGQTTFGTIRDGSVLLTDQKGITTGTIRNGNIFLSNSDGSTTTGSYDKNGNVLTSTSPSSEQQQRDMEQQQRQQQLNLEQQQQKQQEDYEAGATVGRAIGNGIANGLANHRINSFCKAYPTATYLTADAINIDCPKATFTGWEQEQIDTFCADNPGRGIGFGKHMVTCVTPPSTPNLKWAAWEINAWRWDFRNQGNKVMAASSLTSDQISKSWDYWRGVYCRLSPPGAAYKSLDGKKQRCD